MVPGTFDPYRTLGVARGATDAEVKAAHRKLAKRFHPDGHQGDTVRFLLVQEAYRVLSDPLLRKEWDATHAPGPMRAGFAAGASTGTTGRARPPRRQPARPRGKPTPDDTASADPGEEPTNPAAGSGDPRARPRSTRAYTWSASEVPWWEEGIHSPGKRQPGRKRPTADTRRPSERPRPPAGPHDPSRHADHGPHVHDQPSAFDVYNRSSGAAWSMAARAYFRRGDQDLPRRGQFQYEGTQVVTGARARAAAAANEARRRAAASASASSGAAGTPSAEPAPAAGAAGARRGFAPAGPAGAATAAQAAYTSASAGISRDAHRIHDVRQRFQRSLSARKWPSLRDRLLYAVLAWIPAAIVIGYGGATVTGCDAASLACPASLETAQLLLIAAILGVLVAFPKVAYVGALSAAGALVIGLAVIVLMALAGVRTPLSLELTALVGGILLLAYAGTALTVLIRGDQPWATQPSA